MLNTIVTLLCSAFAVIAGILLVIDQTKEYKRAKKMTKYQPLDKWEKAEIIWFICVGYFLTFIGFLLPFLKD